LAVGGGAHGIAHRGTEIEAGMHGRAAKEGIAAHAEAGGEFDLADDGLAIGHQRQGPVEPIDMGAGYVDPVELALERAGLGRRRALPLQRHAPAAGSIRSRRYREWRPAQWRGIPARSGAS